MGKVAEALQDYEQTMSDLGFDIYSTVSRGLERTKVVDRLEVAGVDPIDDVVDWFAFSNGLLPSVPGESRLAGVFDGMMTVSLETALDERTERLHT
ncbi:MAG: hypothetical protein KJO36_09310, partial [Acidimicrobiia bacterium]|nr:hypothetical protein [Acidimicrobiia bacterium]